MSVGTPTPADGLSEMASRAYNLRNTPARQEHAARMAALESEGGPRSQRKSSCKKRETPARLTARVSSVPSIVQSLASAAPMSQAAAGTRATDSSKQPSTEPHVAVDATMDLSDFPPLFQRGAAAAQLLALHAVLSQAVEPLPVHTIEERLPADCNRAKVGLLLEVMASRKRVVFSSGSGSQPATWLLCSSVREATPGYAKPVA
uniref:Uncharacterized protein n=1 Tax=Coccolithus braarudii TaxID=221442 RepID=A0A7S0L9I2_9EUKA|mmetsp:Transcript_27581/g.59388  ORF Transcript_27581/g.59388 Transcript_27581/m.59388 type:complete len:204 (+) Transcript_27581:55-666(+)